jgi:hypothetical protein
MQAQFPSFLKNEPLIWGITLTDLFRLSGVMVLFLIMGINQMMILILTVLVYLGLITTRKIFPRRYFEFLLKKKNKILMKEFYAKV